MLKIFLIGYYGYKNLGDDLLLYEIAEYLKQNDNFDISALSFEAKATTEIYGVKGISRKKGLSIIKHIMSVDVVVCGGGSILQDKTSTKSLFYYMGILFLAKLFGKKVFMLGNGFGPVDKELNKKVLGILLKLVDGVISRDEESYNSYNNYGVKRLFSGVDCAFLNQLEEKSHSRIDDFANYKTEILNNSPYVVISIRDWSGFDSFVSELNSSVEYLIRSGYKVCMIAMKKPEDDELIRKYFSGNDNIIILERDITMLPHIFKNAEFTIGMRLHALILSALSNTPFIALPYDPKVTSFAQQVKQPSLKYISDIEDNELIEAIDNMIEKKLLYKNELQSSLPEICNTAKMQFSVFSQWLDELC